MIKKLEWQNITDGKTFINLIETGALVLGDSDTVIGLYSGLTQAGFDQINAIKGRSEKPYLILVRDKAHALSYCAQDHILPLQDIMQKVWPGPVTLIVRAKKKLPRFLTSADGATIALRVPAHAGLQYVLQAIDGLFSTSANITGHPTPHSIQEVDLKIRDAVRAIITDGLKRIEQPASTILDCTGDRIKLVRAGTISLDKLDI